MIGLGNQDSFSEAEDFVDRHDMSAFGMYWEDGYLAWQYFGITGQPSAVLMEPDGTPVKSWSGAFDLDEVLEAAAAI